MQKDFLSIVIVGHVDHGKSTLIGRLLFDTHSLPDGKVESVKKRCEKHGMAFEYANLLDSLREEQEQNITIDTTQIRFKTSKRDYVIIDAPGHKEFLKNMITGAASADAAILMIDAKEGVQEQSRRHGFLLSLLGIKRIIVAVNKMDLVNFDQATFDKLEAEYREFLQKFNVTPNLFIPISAKNGFNLANRSTEMPWYKGSTALQALDEFQPPANQENLPLRFMVQDIYRFDTRRIIAGRIESGKLKVGDELVFWPDRKRSKVKSIELWSAPTPPTEAIAGQAVAITLEEQIFVERGQFGSNPQEGPVEGREFQARLFWLQHESIFLDRPYTFRIGTQEVEARIVKIDRILDSSTLEISQQARSEIRRNDVAEVTIRTRRPIAFDNQDKISTTGRFVLIQGDRIGGGGIIFGAEYPNVQLNGVTSDNISWSEGDITRESRVQHFGHRGAVIWLTGLSGSGKSTISIALEKTLFQRGIAAYVLDGDNLRHGLCSDLAFSDKDRQENIRRAGEVARLMAEAGLVVVTALISPFQNDRRKVREICHEAGIPFSEIYINTPLEICEQRDPKNLYKKARAGEIKGFTGIDAPYETPAKPNLEIRTANLTVEESVAELLGHVQKIISPSSVVTAEAQEPGAGI
ncbi:MAG: adenylyl-sulfate kinase [Verrucomicrobiota bacterium]